MKRLFADSENNTPVARWWARGAGIGLAALFLAAINFGPTSTIATMLTGVFVGIVIAFFWEGIGGAIIALAALAIQEDVSVNAGGGLNPVNLVFVFVGLASIYCWWRTRHLSLTHQPA